MTTRKSHKRRGSKFEIDLTHHFRDLGYPAERLPRTGRNDEGDVAVPVYDEHVHVIEAKAPGAGNAIDLSGWLREAETEAANYAAARGLNPDEVTPVVVIKARGKSLNQAYVVKRFTDEYETWPTDQLLERLANDGED